MGSKTSQSARKITPMERYRFVICVKVLASLMHLANTFSSLTKLLHFSWKIIFQIICSGLHEKLKRGILCRPNTSSPNESKLKAMFLTPIIKACLNDKKEAIWAKFVYFLICRSVLKAENKPFSGQQIL